MSITIILLVASALIDRFLLLVLVTSTLPADLPKLMSINLYLYYAILNFLFNFHAGRSGPLWTQFANAHTHKKGPGMAIFFKSGGLAVGAKPIDSQEGLAAQLILTLELDAPLMTKETLVKTTSPCYAIAASTSRPRGEITLYGA